MDYLIFAAGALSGALFVILAIALSIYQLVQRAHGLVEGMEVISGFTSTRKAANDDRFEHEDLPGGWKMPAGSLQKAAGSLQAPPPPLPPHPLQSDAIPAFLTRPCRFCRGVRKLFKRKQRVDARTAQVLEDSLIGRGR